MSDSITLCSVTLECPDAVRLAEFMPRSPAGECPSAMRPGPPSRARAGGSTSRPGYTPPVWPDPASPMQMHLDFDVDDLAASEARVLAAGATKYDVQPNEHCLVYADPAGHPFCLSTEDVPDQG